MTPANAAPRVMETLRRKIEQRAYALWECEENPWHATWTIGVRQNPKDHYRLRHRIRCNSASCDGC